MDENEKQALIHHFTQCTVRPELLDWLETLSEDQADVILEYIGLSKDSFETVIQQLKENQNWCRNPPDFEP